MKEVNLFGTEEEIKEIDELKKKLYTTKISIPQYLPSDTCPLLKDCVDTTKYDELVAEINNSNITPEEKYFLKLAATRHIKFTYDKIADYYAHSNKEVQRLMEHSVLVILDIDNAISEGYVTLSTTLDDIMKDDISE